MNRVCPKCRGANVRRSSTPAAELTWRNRIYSRYRCRECLTEFWVISRKTYMAVGTVMGAIVLAVIIVLAMEAIFSFEPAPARRRSDEGVPARVAEASVRSFHAILEMRRIGVAPRSGISHS